MKRPQSFLLALLLLAASAAEAQFTFSTNADNTLTITSYAGPPWNVSIPATTNGRTVTVIGDGAFYGTSIISVLIPDTVTDIEDQAFYDCQALATLTIGDGVTNIEELAFGDCTSLTSVNIPNSVTSIADQAFGACSSLTNITVNAQNAYYSSAQGVLFNLGQTTLVEYPAGDIGSYAVPASVTDIGVLAFVSCTNLTSVTLPNGLATLEAGAFQGCTGLINITIPASVTNLGDLAFAYCTNLTAVNFQGNAPAVGGSVFESDSKAMVYYLSGAAGWTSPFAGLPALFLSGQLQVTLLPPAANGQWRFPWEVTWRNSGTTVSNLPVGDYPIIFSTVPGYLTPTLAPPGFATVSNGATSFVTNVYVPITSSTTVNSVGSLAVNFGPKPPAGASWAIVGTAVTNMPPLQNTNLPAGTYLITFARVSGYATPGSLSVLVSPGSPTMPTVTYLPSQPVPAGFSSLPTNVASTEFTEVTPLPFGYNGQLVTDVGYGSGVAVETNVVLTAAHLVFNDQTLSYANKVFWFPQQEIGVSGALPQPAQGWYVLSGYAAQRINDVQSGFAPGQYSPAARNYDVAALFFTNLVAGTTVGGFLSSDATPNPWLVSTNEKMLVGYPADGSEFGATNIVNGQMYETGPQTNGLVQATDSATEPQVYTADWFLSFLGNDGGPLYVQTNGVYFPAAIYLGTLYEGSVPYASAVRAIDGDVTNLIHLAAIVDQSKKEGPPGGVIPLAIFPGEISATNPGLIQIQLQPAMAVRAGAGWRFLGETSYHVSDYVTPVYSNNLPVEFAQVNGYNSPTGVTSVTAVAGQLSTYVGNYSANGSGPVTNNPLALTVLTNGEGKTSSSDGANANALLAVGKKYKITASMLPGSDWRFANWSIGTDVSSLGFYSSNAAISFTMSNDLILEANFVNNPFSATAGTYNGLFSSADGVTEQTAGMLKDLTVTEKGTYSGSIQINGSSHGFSGTFDNAGQASNTISRSQAQGGNLSITMTLVNLNNSPPQITGTVSGRDNEGLWSATLAADRATNTLLSAEYTLLIQPDTHPSVRALAPGGDGYALITNYPGTAKNPRSATAKITGALPDGTAFSQSVAVSETGNVPLYADIYKNEGLLLGWINLSPSGSAGPGLTWVHPTNTSKTALFKSAFISTNPVALSLWTNPSADGVLTTLTNLVIGTNSFSILINSPKAEKVSGSDDLTGSLAPKTGLLTLTVGKATGYAVILLNATNGGGYMVTKSNAQAIYLSP